MKNFIRNVIFCSLIGAVTLVAQQDLTVQWKATLQDLEHRVAGLPTDGGSAAAAWREDAESLRSAITSFAASNPQMNIQVPEALPEASPHLALTQQLDLLNAAVNQVVQHTPG